MIEVTPKAAGKIRQMVADANRPEGGLRLGVVGGGCSGLSYKFRIENQARPNDQVFEVEGATLIVDPKSHQHLNGLTLDYQETLLSWGFVFHNPNAQKTCGCGKSFLT